MSNPTSQLIADLNNATFWINRLSPIILIVFGTIGNLFNIVIFTRRSLRTNPCSMYFLASSMANCIVMYVALLTRYLATSWNIDPSATNTYWCKIRYLLIYPALSLALWFIVLASIDRYLTSSDQIRHRQWSSVPIARKTILLTTIVMFTINLHVLIFARAEIIDGTATCTILPNEYLVFFNLFVPIISCIVPLILMSIFGLLTIINIRRIRHRVAPHDNRIQNDRLRTNDRQLIIMLLIQVFITTIIVAPWSVINMFSAIGITILKYKFSPLDQTVYNFAFNLSRMLYYINPVLSFYIYTLSGPRFRVEIKNTFISLLKTFLKTTGLFRFCPLRIQRALLNDSSRILTQHHRSQR
jgi:hypothetical protein